MAEGRQRIVVRPLTALLLLLAVALVVLGIYYFATPARSLASFVPGHDASSSRHHVKHGITMLGLAALALVGAWFASAPAHTTEP